MAEWLNNASVYLRHAASAVSRVALEHHTHEIWNQIPVVLMSVLMTVVSRWVTRVAQLAHAVALCAWRVRGDTLEYLCVPWRA